MGKGPETGHAVNIQNYGDFISGCAALGSAYRPVKAIIKLDKMQVHHLQLVNAQNAYIVQLGASKVPINNRQNLFEPLDKLVTRSINYYGATDADKRLVEDAKTWADKIRGFNTRIPEDENGNPDPDHVSQSQQGYVQRVNGFKNLISIYKADPVNYAPDPNDVNTSELTIASMEAYASAMQEANEGLGALLQPMIQARMLRNELLYAEDTGAVDVVKEAKEYLKSLPETLKPQVKLLLGISLRRR